MTLVKDNRWEATTNLKFYLKIFLSKSKNKMSHLAADLNLNLLNHSANIKVKKLS